MGLIFNFLAVLLFVTIALFVYEYVYKLHTMINFYKAQGVTICSGAGRPLIGNAPADLPAYLEYCKEKNPGEMFLRWLLHTKIEPGSDDSFKPENHKAILWNRFGKPLL